MQTPQPNPRLATLNQSEALVLSEKLYHIGQEGFAMCGRKCITHFGEDSIPYHPGEKTCLDRCVNKVKEGLWMAADVSKKFDEKLKAGEMPYQWMRDAAAGKFANQ